MALQQSPLLRPDSGRQLQQQQLPLIGQPREARLTADVAHQICERTASAMVLEGSIARLGSEYVLGLRARDCNTGNILDEQQIQAARREDVLNSLSDIARKLRTRLGETRATVEKHSAPLADVTTPSLEAWKAYTTAMKVSLSSGTAASIPFFQRAVEIDPQFAMAYASLGLAYSAGGQSRVLAAENTTTAWRLREPVSHLAADLEKRFPEDTFAKLTDEPVLRALSALERGKPADSVERLQIALPYEWR